jgi:predicted nucleic acid-binding protein
VSYLLDAHWVTSFLNGRSDATQLITRISNEGLALSVVSYGEIYEGLDAQVERVRQFETFLATVDIVEVNVDIARRYAVSRAYLRTRGLLIPENDPWIAATALTYNFTLVSRDRHFSRIPGLNLYLN